MPDGDKFHKKLSGIYQKPYRILCAGKLNTDECAWAVMDALKRDIKSKGAEPIVLAKQVGEALTQVINSADDNHSVDWGSLSKKLDRLVRQTTLSHKVKELVIHSTKCILHDLRYGLSTIVNSFAETFVERYMRELYKSNFEKRIPLTSKHYASVDPAILNDRVNAIQPDIFAAISKWAKKANADEGIENLRRPKRRKVNEVALDEDLL